jgi:hypothetical protein
MAWFLQIEHKFCGLYECRGTRFMGARKLSPVTKLVASTEAVSRYKASRSKRFVTEQELVGGQLRVSGYKGHY